MTRTLPPSPIPPCRIPATASHPTISVDQGVYQSLVGILQSQYPCGLQLDFGEQVQNLE